MRKSGVHVQDFVDAGMNLENIPDGTYDAVFCLGVIEHIPHTPRIFLQSLDRILKPRGTLVIDTPNIGYLYTRRKLSMGQSVMAHLSTQFVTELPFEGHHREYTVEEVRWMLSQIGQTDIVIETFNYSVFGLTELVGQELADQEQMDADPSLREIILSTSRKRL